MIAEQRPMRRRIRDNLSSSMSPTRLKTDAQRMNEAKLAEKVYRSIFDTKSTNGGNP